MPPGSIVTKNMARMRLGQPGVSFQDLDALCLRFGYPPQGRTPEYHSVFLDYVDWLVEKLWRDKQFAAVSHLEQCREVAVYSQCEPLTLAEFMALKPGHVPPPEARYWQSYRIAVDGHNNIWLYVVEKWESSLFIDWKNRLPDAYWCLDYFDGPRRRSAWAFRSHREVLSAETSMWVRAQHLHEFFRCATAQVT